MRALPEGEVPLPANPETEKLELLVEASSRLLSSLSLPDVLSSLLDLSARAIPVDAYCIWRRRATGEWHPVTSKGLSQNYLDQGAPGTPGPIPPHPIIFHDLGADPVLANRRELYASEGVKALVAMPLSIQGKLEGTLVFYCRQPHVFDRLELKLASAIANLAGAAITSAELFEEQRRLVREKEESQKRTAFLAEASQILASSLDYKTTLAAVAHLTIGHMADWCTVDIADPAGGPPRRLAMAHIDPTRIVWAEELRSRYPPDVNDPSARVIRTGEPVLISVIEEARLTAAARDEEHLRILRELGPVSFLCVPMRARGSILGALSFLTVKLGRQFGEPDLLFAQDLANRCALAIDNARLYSEAKENAAKERESRTEIETLNRIGQILSAELNLENLVQAVTDAATGITGAQFGSFFYNVLNDKGESYMLYTLSGVPREPFAGFPMPRATELFGPTFRGEGIVRIGNVKTDPRYGKSAPYYGMPPGHLPVVSYLAVPVTSRSGEVIGGLFFGHGEPDVFTERHERIVGGLASQASIAMENALLVDSVQKARKDLTDAHEQLSNILESTSDAFIALDGQWRVTHANARAAAMAGRSREDLLGKDLRDVIKNSRDDLAFPELERAVQTQQPIEFEQHVASSNVWIEVHACPTRFGLAIFGRDVTEKKRFAEQLRQTAKLESLGVLAGGVAHDFNNILVGILGNASLALESVSPSSPVRETLQDVVTSTERAANLTRQLLAYAGKGRFVIQLLDLSDLIREISVLLQTSIPRSVQLRLQLTNRLPCMEGDAAQIQQLLMNLIINAAEAIGESATGSVTVTTGVVDADEHYLRHILAAASELQPGQYVSVEVSDNGCGMDAETIARIFDPFFTTKFTGRGLGLAAALGIVRGHRGALKVYSTPGEGSTFKVLFPAIDAPAEKRAEEVKQVAGGTGLILIVDDEEIVRRTAKKTLERYGYHVITAEDGSEAVNLFGPLAEKVSLVILDLTMPVMGGEETLRRLKTMKPDVRVVLSSGFNEVEAIQRFTGKGLAGFIQKPYTAARLAERVKDALGK